MKDMDKIENYNIDEGTHIKKDEAFDDIIEPKIGFFNSICKFINNMLSSNKKIGDLNGKWAGLFKFVLILCILVIPSFFTWASWVTAEVFASKYSRNHIEHFEERIVDLEANSKLLSRVENELIKISNKVDDLPPPDWKRRIEILENQRAIDETRTIEQYKANQDDHNKILILLEGIKAKIELIK